MYIEKFTVDLETRKWTIDVEGIIIYECPIYYGNNFFFGGGLSFFIEFSGNVISRMYRFVLFPNSLEMIFR